MAARFVTFTPLTAGESLVIPSSIMDGSHMSFEPKCLAKQSETGSANTIWEWTDAEASPPKGHLNTVTKEYKSGANYYHTFGGNHRYCDVFRRDPCTYAPFLTPTLNDDNNNDIDDSPSVQWKLYVNDCDATWVGRASVESLRALRQPDGSATFNLINENQLEGTLYTQVVKPTSWTEPAKGVVSSSKAYKLVLTIKDSIVVDIAVNGGSSMKASTDIQFVSSEHKSTTERVYGYALRIFPYRVNATTQSNEYIDNCKIKDVTLIDYTVKSPNKYDCPTCTGTRYSCTGTGNGYETDCGDAEVVRFEPYDESIINWDQTEESLGGKNLFPSTDLNSTYMLLHRFFVRVRGSNTASSAGSSPMIHFRLKILLDSGESFEVSVDQTSYVSEINANFVHSKVCRSTSYWPVADALGSSLPAKPYNITLATFPDVKYDETLNAVLLSPEQCEANVGSETQVTLPSQKAATTSGKDATMCAAEDVREYGVSDWVFFALPSVTKAESSSTTSQSDTGILVSDGTLKEGQYTIAEIQYLVLSVKATEAISFLSTAESSDVPDDTTEYINILLDGKKPPVTVDAEEDIWMAPDPSNVEALNTVTYYDWMKYASFLNYRRISLEDASSSKKEGNPFNFAFIPGAVLHSSSSVRVPMYMKLAIKFTTYETSKVGGKDSIVGERMEKLFLILPVSRSTSAELRFETDTYTPKLVDVHVDGIGKKTASWLLIVFFVAVVVILAASIYIEVTYKQKIHNAKYKPKRPDSAVGVRYGRDGKPKAGYGYENDSTIAGSTANRDEASSHTKQKVSAKKGTTSKFGTIQTEQVRVGEDDVSVDIEDKLGDEQERVSIGSDEKAKY
ncbi:hypothetical protein AGDE_09917 [Angomonas deanei]|uniref:Uncharacterized protein n=1 Tax=Angomonas deanei TaxID=59799 RepID=S9U3B7_9TRYP|nr:hypothetical protein AGDE_11916 [Angomonas deanei]EPY29694.1 hypothetical protein AGDE_09917 [Angomonas deanei]CAD2216425.1 hypothetical protein, conserved [Angomonas deanei]|eukprot:EPY25292.1 hypothetical protein AGDE_11916 [Angomonas deanei]